MEGDANMVLQGNRYQLLFGFLCLPRYLLAILKDMVSSPNPTPSFHFQFGAGESAGSKGDLR